jgi:uncharacterized protein (DUF697 family)
MNSNAFQMTMKNAKTSEWAVMPASGDEIARVREHCRRLVKKRAAISAGVAAVPLPGLDLLSDLANFALMVEEINKAFGLTPAQIERLQPKMRVIAYEAAAALGGMLVGKLVTRELVLQLFKRSGMKLAAKTAAKVVPLAGQVASAAIGFALFRQMGYQHVEACVKVARQVVEAGEV